MPRVKKNPNRRPQAAMPKDQSPSSSAIPQGPETSGSASMPPKKLVMKWNNHKINIVSVLGSYVLEGKFVDVTIVCERKKMKSHQLVLSASSPYFHDIFLENPCQHPVLFIHGVKYEIIKSLLEFIYKGEVVLSQHDIPSFLEAAETFAIKGLSLDPERPMPPRKENRKRPISEIDEKEEDNAKKINQQPSSNGIQKYDEADEEIEHAKSLEQNLTADNINEITKAKTMPDVQEPGYLPASESQEVLTENPSNFPAEDIGYNNENEPYQDSLDESTPDDECSQPEIICISDNTQAKGIISLWNEF